MKKTARKKLNRFPAGWDEKKVKRLARHYEDQSEVAAAKEDEKAYRSTRTTMVAVPVELVPQVEKLIAKRAG